MTLSALKDDMALLTSSSAIREPSGLLGDVRNTILGLCSATAHLRQWHTSSCGTPVLVMHVQLEE